MSERISKIEELFHTARALPSAEARQAYLDRSCAGDAALRAAVERLLASDVEARDSFLSAPALEPSVAGEQAGDLIGRYKLLQEIGEGGMGTVWMAEQREPVIRKVALKIVKLGMDTREVIVRFESERQALALMDHPNIAKVLDGGATASGRPYFVMELVRGVPITEFADKAKLGLRDRLELFGKVCEAIQHAHHKGVIHRDIKPSNVLVTLHDGVPVPKVIDFGIAKATSAELTQRTLFTQYGQILGTPEYMAPEQAEMSGLDIDTRADVYSLGVLLYELLTGTKPFDARDALKQGFQELLRRIREVDPAKPSTRISTLGERASPTAANRQVNVAGLSARLRGDLDLIVMKALEKDRTRRYDTPIAFAGDVERFLRDEPVLAAPPSASYRFRKFVRRRRKTVAAGALVLALLVLGILGTSFGLWRARIAAEEERMAKLEADARRTEAERNLGYARKGNEILTRVVGRIDPLREIESLGELRSALRAGLEDAAVALASAQIGDPLEVARLEHRLGRSLYALGEHEAARQLFERAAATYREKLGALDEDSLSATHDLGMSLLLGGQLERGLATLQDLLALRREHFGAQQADTLETMIGVAEALERLGRSEEAAAMFTAARPLLEAVHGPAARPTILCIANLAGLQVELGFSKEAIRLYDTALERARSGLGPEHPDTIGIQTNLALAYQKAHDLERAIPLYEATRKALRERLGKEHPKALVVSNNLASAYNDAGKSAEAAALLDEVLQIQEAQYGIDHPDSLSAASSLAAIYIKTGKNDLALPLLERTVRAQRQTLPADHPKLLNGLNNLGASYWKAERFPEAIALFEEILKFQEAKYGREHPATLATIANLAANLKGERRYAEARPLLEEVYAASSNTRGLRPYVVDLLEVYLRLGLRAEAAPLFEVAVKMAHEELKPESTKLATELLKLGQTWLELDAAAEAEPVLREVVALREKLQPEAWSTSSARSLLGAAIAAQGRLAEAEPILIAGFEGIERSFATVPPQSRYRLEAARARLVELYTKWEAEAPGSGHAARATQWRERVLPELPK
ncbi:MAG: tetratricopeptide repeat protein [Planctomycetes bacterium]|nr:tetratricopeptide repeat protein [Planctomycetota bacterium]